MEEHNIIHGIWTASIIWILYVIIFVGGIIANLLVIFIILSKKSYEAAATDFFLLNLCATNIILGWISVPLTPLYTYLGGWYFGSFMCPLLPVISTAAVFNLALTTTVMVLERFVFLLKNRKLTRRHAIYISCGIWIVCLLACTPYAMYTSFQRNDDGDPKCLERWPGIERRAFGIVCLLVHYGLPAIIIPAVFVKLFRNINSHNSVMVTDGLSGAKERTNLWTLVWVAVAIGFCYFPIEIFNLMVDFSLPPGGHRWFSLIFLTVHIFAVSSTVTVPAICLYCRDDFRGDLSEKLSRRSVAVKNSKEEMSINEWL